jgi:hypothetical protein
MPMVNGEKFPYTAKGKKDAKKKMDAKKIDPKKVDKKKVIKGGTVTTADRVTINVAKNPSIAGKATAPSRTVVKGKTGTVNGKAPFANNKKMKQMPTNLVKKNIKVSSKMNSRGK